jgi:uncharacterized membrane protein HdeD (DUF308 family)
MEKRGRVSFVILGTLSFAFGILLVLDSVSSNYGYVIFSEIGDDISSILGVIWIAFGFAFILSTRLRKRKKEEVKSKLK